MKTTFDKKKSMANTALSQQIANKQALQFADNRPEAITQRKFQNIANNSSRTGQIAQLQTAANEHSNQQQPIQKQKNNTGLPDNLKSGIENLSGYSMNDVKVHFNSDKPAQLNAHAYAQGTNIHVASGQEKHLPHEAWHVVQQKQGRVKPTMQMKGKVNINDDQHLEKEADVMGAKANSMPARSTVDFSQFDGGLLVDLYNSGNNQNSTQRQEIIQRIIVVEKSQLDFNQFVGIYQMLINGIDDRVTLLSILGKSDIKDEQIGLRGHGYGQRGSYAGMSAKKLASLLMASGVNETNEVIDLLSCKSGRGGAASYAEELAKELGHSTTVYSNRGLGVLMDDGYSYSKRDRTAEETVEYKAIFTDCKLELAAAKEVAKEGEALLLAPDINEAKVKDIFLEYGAKVLKVAGTLYQKLYAHQRKLIADNDDPQNGLYVSPKK